LRSKRCVKNFVFVAQLPGQETPFFHRGVGVESKQRFSALLISSVLIMGFQAVFENQFRDAQPVDIAAGKGYSSNTTA
jgi:hypothetical protein